MHIDLVRARTAQPAPVSNDKGEVMTTEVAKATPEHTARAVSTEELVDRGKKLDAAIEALRIRVKAREAEEWQLKRQPVR